MKTIETSTIPWPPHTNELEDGKEVCDLLVQLMTWLKHPTSKSALLSPNTV